jgi:hypothetical protein
MPGSRWPYLLDSGLVRGREAGVKAQTERPEQELITFDVETFGRLVAEELGIDLSQPGPVETPPRRQEQVPRTGHKM